MLNQRRGRLLEMQVRLAGLSVPAQLVLGLAGLIAIGAVLLKIPAMTSHPITWMDAIFTATSAASVTGLVLFNTATTFTFAGQIVILLLVQIGGAGLLVIWVYLVYLFRRRISHEGRLAVITSLGLERSAPVPLLLGRTVRWMLLVEAVGAVALFVRWAVMGIPIDAGMAFYAIFHAITAFCNAGFDLFNGLPQFPNGIPSDAGTLVILGLLIIIGGLGVPVYLDFLRSRRTGRRLRLHTRVTLRIALILILFGWAALLLSEYWKGGVLSGAAFFDRFFRAWFQSVSARTAGFSSLVDFPSMHADSRLVMIVLMFIGSGPASMGGGITTGTLVVLIAAVSCHVRRLPQTSIGSRAIPLPIVQRAIVVFITGIVVVMTATWLILLTHPFPLDEALFEVVSAFSTTGLSLGATPQLNTFGRWVIILVMFWGRLGATTLMVSLLGGRQRESLVEYPEEGVLVG
jgi:trk system potassium uptake protein TrkH